MELDLARISLHHVQMELKSPFATSFGTLRERDCILIEIQDQDGVTGWGECVAFSTPWYTEETTKTAAHMMKDFLIPLLFEKKIAHPAEVTRRFAGIRRNPMAKAGLESAVWDLFAKKSNQTLASLLGGTKTAVDVGVAIGIAPVDQLLQQIEEYMALGYKRIKQKIKPGYDRDLLYEIRCRFPDVPLMADANSAYSLQDLPLLKSLDELDLMMIEQPLASDDIIDHAALQAELATPVCLDESILSVEDARKAIDLGSCRVINIKIGRVGGLWEAKQIHDLCRLKQIPVWCGGMFESGIGRAHNIALTTLEQFVLPGDTSGSSRYWEQDLVVPEVTVADGAIEVPDLPGIGYEVDCVQLEKVTQHRQTFTNPR